MDIPKTVEDLNLLIKNEVQESTHLDYKASPAIDNKKKGEIAKDASAFANSDGGIIIYGIQENEHLPVKIDEGVDHSKYTREWLEQVINSNISPIIDGIEIVQIPLSSERSSFVIKIPKSYRTPHQEQISKKYYRRYNFLSQPMEDYEINEIRNRSFTITPLVNFDVNIKHGVIVYFVISNIGKVPAENVFFTFSKQLMWHGEERKPPILTKGIKYLPPGRTFKIRFNSSPEIFKKENESSIEFDVSVSYFHPEISQNITDIFHIDLNDYLYTDISESELNQHGKKIEESIGKLTSELKKLNDHIAQISSIAAPTGLDISISTLRNIKHIISGKDTFTKIDPQCADYQVFKEVLEIDIHLAMHIQMHFSQEKTFEDLSHLDGMTEEILDQFKQYFITENR
jgi:hypothetical protein